MFSEQWEEGGAWWWREEGELRRTPTKHTGDIIEMLTLTSIFVAHFLEGISFGHVDSSCEFFSQIVFMRVYCLSILDFLLNLSYFYSTVLSQFTVCFFISEKT